MSKLFNTLLVLSFALAGCSDDPAPARNFQVSTTVTIEPAEERYACYRVNVTEDIFVSGISTEPAPGVHHQILAMASEKEAEGLSECGLVLAETNSWMFLASSRPGQFTMPPGVAYPIPAGSQLILQMHLYNSGDSTLTSDVTVNLAGIPEAEVVDRAQLVAAGSLNITLPPGQVSTVSGTCTLDEDVQIFGLLPHMHALGTSFKAWIDNGGEQIALYDDIFSGETEPFQNLEPRPMPAGAALKVECHYLNTTSDQVTYGQSALDEMCYGYTYYYPAIEGQGPLCLN